MTSLAEDLEEMSAAELLERGRALRDAIGRIRSPSTGRISVTRGDAVEGTGRAMAVSNPDVRRLIEDATKAGATVRKTASSHYRVEYLGRSRNIAATPRSERTVRNDRARLRRDLGLGV